MPAVRKPTALLEASGALKHDPAKFDRSHEPDTGRGVGPAPDYFTDAQRVVWDEIVANCAPGVFQSSDRTALEGLACLMAEFRAGPEKFGGRKYTLLINLLSRCGMTPADRSKVHVKPREQSKPKTGLASYR